jgi:hypothetical protein
MTDAVVTITQEEYEKLLDESRTLYWLEYWGVDNWEGYDNAMRSYWKEFGDKDEV